MVEPLDFRSPKQEEIPGMILTLTCRLEAAEAEVEWVRARIKAVQDICKHPNVTKGKAWGRWPYTRCDVCGKEW